MQVNVQLSTVDAFGIRLSPQLAAAPERIIAQPAGQIVPPSLGGPAYLWLINSTGLELFSFTVDTTGQALGASPLAAQTHVLYQPWSIRSLAPSLPACIAGATDQSDIKSVLKLKHLCCSLWRGHPVASLFDFLLKGCPEEDTASRCC